MDMQNNKQMYIVSTTCWKCDGAMNAAVINGDKAMRNGQVYGPESFSAEEVSLAREHAVVIQEHYSRTRMENYVANTCPHCQTFLGQHYLFTDVFCSAQYGDSEFKVIDLFK